MCLGQFSGDQAWYRARVEAADSRDPVNPQYSVAFIDYGNKETLPASRVRAIQPQLEAVPPQAMLCTLAYLKVCSTSHYGSAASGACLTVNISGCKCFRMHLSER